jgi:hypothetical protein
MWARSQVSQQDDSRAIPVGDNGTRRGVDDSDIYLDLVFLDRDGALDDGCVFRRVDVRVRVCFGVLLRSRAGVRVSGLTEIEGASS